MRSSAVLEINATRGLFQLCLRLVQVQIKEYFIQEILQKIGIWCERRDLPLKWHWRSEFNVEATRKICKKRMYKITTTNNNSTFIHRLNNWTLDWLLKMWCPSQDTFAPCWSWNSLFKGKFKAVLILSSPSLSLNYVICFTSRLSSAERLEELLRSLPLWFNLM